MIPHSWIRPNPRSRSWLRVRCRTTWIRHPSRRPQCQRSNRWRRSTPSMHPPNQTYELASSKAARVPARCGRWNVSRTIAASSRRSVLACQQPIKSGQLVARCFVCGASHHATCSGWTITSIALGRGARGKARLARRMTRPPAHDPQSGSKQAISRVLFPAGLATCGSGDHLSRAAIARRLTSDLTRRSRTSSPRTPRARPPPYVVLLQTGFTRPAGHPAAGELLPHHFTLAGMMPAVCFCGTFLGVTPTGRYPAPCSAELGLSSCGVAARDHLACLGGFSVRTFEKGRQQIRLRPGVENADFAPLSMRVSMLARDRTMTWGG